MNVRDQVIAAKVESTKGTAETLANADAFFARSISFGYTPTQIERPRMRSTLSKDPSIVTQKVGTISFSIEMKGSGTVDTSPPLGKLLRACGCDETVNASTSVVWTPESEDADSDTITIGRYVQSGATGMVEYLYGARGTCVLTFAAGEISTAQFTFTGKYTARAVGTVLTVTGLSTLPPVLENAAMSLQGFSTGVFSQFVLDLGNEVSLRPDANATDGLDYAKIVNRAPTATLDLDRVLNGTFDIDAAIEASTTGSFTLTLGSATGNTLTLAAPKVQILGRGDGDRGGVSVDELNLQLCIDSAGDDEFSLTHD